jgi:hypothetical protein
MAYAGACKQDPVTGRPLAGYVRGIPKPGLRLLAIAFRHPLQAVLLALDVVVCSEQEALTSLWLRHVAA